MKGARWFFTPANYHKYTLCCYIVNEISLIFYINKVSYSPSSYLCMERQMLAKETHDLIQQLHADGMPKLRIANQLNLTHRTVVKHIKNPIWKPYKRANMGAADHKNKKDKLPLLKSLSVRELLDMDFRKREHDRTIAAYEDREAELSIAAYEDRMMKSRTGCS
jgi:hypothetical protein